MFHLINIINMTCKFLNAALLIFKNLIIYNSNCDFYYFSNIQKCIQIFKWSTYKTFVITYKEIIEMYLFYKVNVHIQLCYICEYV